jgi:hypothetical protein
MTIRGSGHPINSVVSRTVVRMGPPPGALLPKRICCFMVRIRCDPTEYKIAGQVLPASASSPRPVGWRPHDQTGIHPPADAPQVLVALHAKGR